MKKYLVVFVFIVSSIISFSQITVAETDGTPLNDGDIRVYNIAGDEADLKLVITNNAAKQIEIKVRCESIDGASGEGMSFCVYNCYSGISVGKEYPLEPAQFFLDAGESSGTNEVHFQHNILSGDPDATSYILKLFEVGNEANNSIEFTYKYDANYSGTENAFGNFYRIYPNPALNYISVETGQNTEYMTIKNSLGKNVYFSALRRKKKVDLSNFPAGMYFCSFYNKNNKHLYTKKLLIR